MPDQNNPPHGDMVELIAALRLLCDKLEPLTAHVPVLIEMSKTWSAAATTGKTIGRFGMAMSAFGKWVTGVALGVAGVWALLHGRWSVLIEAFKP